MNVVKTLTVRLSLADYQKLVDAAWNARLSRAAFIRKAISLFINSGEMKKQ